MSRARDAMLHRLVAGQPIPFEDVIDVVGHVTLGAYLHRWALRGFVLAPHGTTGRVAVRPAREDDPPLRRVRDVRAAVDCAASGEPTVTVPPPRPVVPRRVAMPADLTAPAQHTSPKERLRALRQRIRQSED
jgi:hypothetical protein